MKKNIFLVVASMLVTTQTFAAQEGQRTKKASKCCNRTTLETVAYKLSLLCKDNDYRHLASKNSVWFLKKKIALRENLADLDRYWTSSETIVDAKSAGKSSQIVTIKVFVTPLHEAIEQGNIECVELLCVAGGADKTKKIKGSLEGLDGASQSYIKGPDQIKTEDRAEESYSQSYGFSRDVIRLAQFEDYIQGILDRECVGLSAVEYAEKLTKYGRYYGSVPEKQRRAVYEYLRH